MIHIHAFVVDISYEQILRVLKKELPFPQTRIVIFYDLDEDSTYSIAISPFDDDGITGNVTLIVITVYTAPHQARHSL